MEVGAVRPGASSRREGELAEELQELLIDATRIRLRSDVPVGAYLPTRWHPIGFGAETLTEFRWRTG